MAHFLQKDAANGLAGGGQGQPVGMDGNPLTPFRVKGDVGALGPFEFRAATEFDHQAEAWPAQPLIQFDDAAFEPTRPRSAGFQNHFEGAGDRDAHSPKQQQSPTDSQHCDSGVNQDFFNLTMLMSNQRLGPLQVFFFFHLGHQSIDPEDVMTTKRAS
jgi:hypothetical protein